MKHIGLFEGIGGFSLAARWMGWETIAWCEWNEFGQKVLKHHFPKATGHGNIKDTDFSIYAGQCDIVTGGFPCQPYSAAGKRLGKEDDRHLWPEMLRAITEIQPRWVVGENVSGLLNWNGGMVLNEIKADLEAAGFEVIPPLVLPACAVNAPHRRDRVWIVAYNNNTGGRNGSGINGNRQKKNKGRNGQPQPEYRTDGSNGPTPNTEETDSKQSGNTWNRWDRIAGMGGGNEQTTPNPNINQRSEGRLHTPGQQMAERHAGARNALSDQRNTWDNFPTQSPICSRNDGIPGGLDFDTVWGKTIPRKPFITFSNEQTVNFQLCLLANAVTI